MWGDMGGGDPQTGKKGGTVNWARSEVGADGGTHSHRIKKRACDTYLGRQISEWVTKSRGNPQGAGDWKDGAGEPSDSTVWEEAANAASESQHHFWRESQE